MKKLTNSQQLALTIKGNWVFLVLFTISIFALAYLKATGSMEHTGYVAGFWFLYSLFVILKNNQSKKTTKE